MDMKNKAPFFNAEDIAILKEVGGKKYDKNDPKDMRKGEELKNRVWNKTLYWSELVVNKLEKLGYVGTNSRRLWQNSGTFMRYTWTQIYKKGDEDKGVFFTLGVGLEALDYKLDYQQNNHENIPLSAAQKDKCHSLIRGRRDTWKPIPADKLHEYTWDRLVEETVNFIVEYTPLYDEVIKKVSGINEKRIARIAYNTKGWERPSGKYGKSNDIETYECIYGYGHEEWLFDFAKTYKGYHYAFLEPLRKEHQAYEGNIYDVALFTINGETKQRFYHW